MTVRLGADSGTCTAARAVTLASYGESQAGHVTDTADLTSIPSAIWPRRASPPGAVTGAVVRAGRLSANLGTAQLADVVECSHTMVCLWERGGEPLGSEPPGLVAAVKSALLDAGCDPLIARDLHLAIWCDLIITGLTEQRPGYLDEPASEGVLRLLAWAATGSAPGPYRPYACPRPLLPASDVQLIAAAARLLSGHAHHATQQYGTAIATAVQAAELVPCRCS